MMQPIIVFSESTDSHKYISFKIEGPFTFKGHEDNEAFKVLLVDVEESKDNNNIVNKLIFRHNHSLLFKECERALDTDGHIKLAGHTIRLTNMLTKITVNKQMRVLDEEPGQAILLSEFNPEFSLD